MDFVMYKAILDITVWDFIGKKGELKSSFYGNRINLKCDINEGECYAV